MLKKISLGLVVVIGGFLVFAATRPDTYRVERTAKIAAPADVVYAQIDDFKAWAAWSPWEKLDPQMQKTYAGPERGTGASYAWQGSKEVGKGKMTITESQPPTHLALKLEFIEPFASTADTTFDVKPEGESAASVTWAMQGNNTFMGKVFGIFMNMDSMIGADFEKGLASLDTVAQAEAKKQAEARAQADAAARAAAEAQAQANAAAAPTAAAAQGGAEKKKAP